MLGLAGLLALVVAGTAPTALPPSAEQTPQVVAAPTPEPTPVSAWREAAVVSASTIGGVVGGAIGGAIGVVVTGAAASTPGAKDGPQMAAILAAPVTVGTIVGAGAGAYFGATFADADGTWPMLLGGGGALVGAAPGAALMAYAATQPTTLPPGAGEESCSPFCGTAIAAVMLGCAGLASGAAIGSFVGGAQAAVVAVDDATAVAAPAVPSVESHDGEVAPPPPLVPQAY